MPYGVDNYTFSAAHPAVPEKAFLDTPWPSVSSTHRASHLDFEIIYSDGGEYSSNYTSSNLLEDNNTCYCAEKRGVNVLAKFRGGRSFTLTHVAIRAPREGFTSPLGQGLLFVSWERPDIAATQQFDNIQSVADFQAYVQQRMMAQDKPENQAEPIEPVLFFDMRDTYTLDVELDIPRSGRYVHIKMLRPRNNSQKCDTQFVGFYGSSGPQSFPCGELM